MGESKLKRAQREALLMSCAGVQTMAGRVQVRWETESAATPMGQLAYFIEFLNLTGLWSRWLESCPLAYSSPNAPTKAEGRGTGLLSMLAGHRRYSPVTAMRCDGVNPGLFGMRKVISEDALRNALKRIPEAQGIAWLDTHLADSVAPLLDAPWILDADTPIKPRYGHQDGALIGYNPKKPGRPSHAYHTDLMAGLRQVLGVEVCPGNEHTAKHAQPGLLKALDSLPPEKKPRLVRGDNAFGNEALMRALEEREQPYLFKLELSKNVKRHSGSLFRQSGWTDAGQGWEGKEGELALAGWAHKRRGVVLRRPLLGEVMVESDHDGQQLLAFVESNRKDGKGITDYEVLSLGQLYRDRADAENAFDELKNPWGWGGFTTPDLHRCQLAARGGALAYTGWSLFVRLAHPDARGEAITSRPWLMSSVGRRTEHAGQTTITLTGLHAHFGKARAMLMRVSALLQGWVAQAAEQLHPRTVWQHVCDHLKQTLAGIGPPPTHRLLENHA